MSRIALLHYTSLPVAGGVETLIDLQARTLLDLGHQVRLIVGEGEAPPGAELVVLRGLLPSPLEREGLGVRGTARAEPLISQLRRILHGCDQCWVHNALTVYLHLTLTTAVDALAREMVETRWVAWCHDLSAASVYWPALDPEERERVAGPIPGVTYVTISQIRRRELSELLGLPETTIAVIPPPFDFAGWLEVGAETREILNRLCLLEAEPIVLVPAKLLPHKNLELAVEVAAALRDLTARPLVLVTGAGSRHQTEIALQVASRLRRLAEHRQATSTFHLLSDVLHGDAPRGAVRDLMLLSDLVLLPSTEEGFGLPVLEAVATRTPLLCSDIPAFREAAGAGAQYFSLHAPPEEIARRILDITQGAPDRRRRAVICSRGAFRDRLRQLASA
jgi:glycosyltransferase involved in cell wall biosynthesis